mmetsp:Transcript_18644/g.37687  ORF Transcript_18644/g.37687 Transcript_18644/m.37687 type:complete len:215 (-) Transcript_18644:258-902(-)
MTTINQEEMTSIVSVLIKQKASVTYADNHNKTALMWACMQGSVEPARLLIDAKANIEAMDARGRTPMSLAKDLGQDKIVRLLNKALGVVSDQPSSAALDAKHAEKKDEKEEDPVAEKEDDVDMYGRKMDLDGKHGMGIHRRTKAAEKKKKHAPPKDIHELLERAGLPIVVRERIIEEGYDEIDWYHTSNERDWDRMMTACKITELVKERILACL